MQLSTGIAIASDLSNGWKADDSVDFRAALLKWPPLAEQGNSAAQFNLGLMYEFGKGVLKNEKTAVKWYTLAAGQGYTSAQRNLGVMY